MSKKFYPKKIQKRFFEEFLKSESDSLLSVAKRLEISEDEIESWFENENFRKWAKGKLKSFASKESFEVWKSALIKAKKGDIQASKLVFKLVDDTEQNQSNDIYDDIIKECGYAKDDD